VELTDWVAIYGAVIGSISAFLYLRNWWYDRPRIKVSIAYAMGTGSLMGLHMIKLTAINSGKQTAYINGAGFELRDHRNIWFIDSPLGIPQPMFPKELVPNNNCDVHFLLPDLVNRLVEENGGQTPVAAWFIDVTGKYYKKPVDQDLFSNWVKGARGTN
jgi:hypothetical protein